MSQLPHLKLRKIDYEALRKKRPGFGGSDIDFRMHAPKLQTQVQNVLTGYKTKKLPRGINPSLILKINLTNYVDESEWKKAGLTVLGNYKDKTLILFSTDEDLKEFKKRLGEYSSGPKEGKKSAQHMGFFASIDSINELAPDDRIGRHFRSEGFDTISKFIDTSNYTLDVELWHTGNKLQVNERVEELRTFITSSNGKVTDTYIDDSIVLLRVKCTGIIMNTLFSMPLISSVDLPPKLSLKIEQQEEISLDEVGIIPAPPNNAAGICIIDSGINSGHPPFKCWACGSYIYGDQEQCPECSDYICSKCGYCAPKCEYYTYLNDIKKFNINEPREILNYCLNLKNGLIHQNCIRKVPISYAHKKIRNILCKTKGIKVRNEEDRQKFMCIVNKIENFEIGKTWTVPKERDDGVYGQELRDASNFAVCMGWAEIINERKENKYKGFKVVTYFKRVIGKNCEHFDDVNPWPKYCLKCGDKIIQSYKLTYCPNHPNDKLKFLASYTKICQLPRYDFKVKKEEDKKDGVQEL